MYYIGLDIGGTKCAVCIGEVTDGVLTLIDKENSQQGRDETRMRSWVSCMPIPYPCLKSTA